MNIFDKDFIGSISMGYSSLIFMFFFATVLGFLIAMTYKKTHRGFSYSQSFSLTLLLMTVITAFIIVLIEDSIARAVGIFGAFSIIRFRTAIKDVRDIAFVFFALSAGLAVGVGLFMYGIIWVLLICALIFVLHITNFGGLNRLDFILNFKLNAKNHSNEVFKKVMSKYLKKEMLLNVEVKERGKFLMFTFNISLKELDKLNEFISEMNKITGVNDVSIVSSKNDLEF